MKRRKFMTPNLLTNASQKRSTVMVRRGESGDGR
jgi:hypothetical protein